jgi:hypothetical protein
LCGRTGERPALVTEQLGLDELGRELGTVELHELPGTTAQSVDFGCELFLARAGFSADE